MTRIIIVGEAYYSDLRPDQGLPGQPPGYWGGGNVPMPTPPIAPGGSPPGYWGGVAPPFPTHPIAPGGQPPYPSQGPGFPTNPIVLPPYEPGGPPVTIWPNPIHPSHPIVIPQPPANPPEGNKPPPEDGGWGYHSAYGWGYFPVGTATPK
jgi:hypothetical protein